MDSSSEELFSFKLELLKKEIDVITSVIGRYDDILFRIKSWTITLWIAVVGWGLHNRSILVLLLAIFIPIIFCFIEVEFKRIQRQYIFRGNKLEKFFRNNEKLKKAFDEKDIPENPGVYDPNAHAIGQLSELSEEYKKKINRFIILRFPNVFLFYLSMFILTVVAMFCVILLVCVK